MNNLNHQLAKRSAFCFPPILLLDSTIILQTMATTNRSLSKLLNGAEHFSPLGSHPWALNLQCVSAVTQSWLGDEVKAFLFPHL